MSRGHLLDTFLKNEKNFPPVSLFAEILMSNKDKKKMNYSAKGRKKINMKLGLNFSTLLSM